MKNNAMLEQLISLGKQASTLAKQQSETLHILTRKNVLHPELMEMHLETFLKMKDRERVAEYLQEYLHSAAFLGYLDLSAVDTLKLTQLFRRLYKTPDQVPSTSQLLDYLVVLALSNAYYPEFDPKSVEFVEQAINLIESRFTGMHQLEVPVANPVSGEEEAKVTLNYYESIPSNAKVYNKVLVSQDYHRKKLNFRKAAGELFDSKSDEEAIIDEEEEEIEEAEKPAPKKLPKKKVEVFKDVVDEEQLLLEVPVEEDIPQEAPDFVLREDHDAELHAAVQL